MARNAFAIHAAPPRILDELSVNTPVCLMTLEPAGEQKREEL